MAALIIGEAERQKIAELRAVAAASPLDPVGMKAASDEDMEAFRDMMRTMTIVLPVGYHVCYSHEIQPKAPPPGLCHHMSISVDRDGMMPAVDAVEMILQEFGMRPMKQSEGLWIEDVSPTIKAINLVQLIAQ